MRFGALQARRGSAAAVHVLVSSSKCNTLNLALAICHAVLLDNECSEIQDLRRRQDDGIANPNSQQGQEKNEDQCRCGAMSALVARGRLIAVLSFLLAPCASAGAPDSFHASFDTAVRADGAGGVNRGQLLLRRYQAVPAVVDLGISANVQVGALAAGGDAVYFAPDVSFTAGGLYVTPRGIARRDSNGTITVYLSGSAIGLPATIKIDALALAGAMSRFGV